MSNEQEQVHMRDTVLEAIKKGEVMMRPRWHFVAFSTFALVGIVLVLFSLLYLSSLLVFFLRESGLWFMPAFGMHGWFMLLGSLPWLLILLTVVFLVLLQILVQRYKFVYQKPLVLSIASGIILVSFGGVLIAKTSFHRGMYWYARHNSLPRPMGVWYKPFRSTLPPGIHHGSVVTVSGNRLLLADIHGEGTSTILITRKTRLPYGSDFSPGDFIVVFGERVATDTTSAFGIREVDE